jgi:hypothetical protein
VPVLAHRHPHGPVRADFPHTVLPVVAALNRGRDVALVETGPWAITWRGVSTKCPLRYSCFQPNRKGCRWNSSIDIFTRRLCSMLCGGKQIDKVFLGLNLQPELAADEGEQTAHRAEKILDAGD